LKMYPKRATLPRKEIDHEQNRNDPCPHGADP
jgi:hypothetical protein